MDVETIPQIAQYHNSPNPSSFATAMFSVVIPPNAITLLSMIPCAEACFSTSMSKADV